MGLSHHKGEGFEERAGPSSPISGRKESKTLQLGRRFSLVSVSVPFFLFCCHLLKPMLWACRSCSKKFIKLCSLAISNGIVLKLKNTSTCFYTALISVPVPQSFSPEESVCVLCLSPPSLFILQCQTCLSSHLYTPLLRVTHSSSSSVCPAILQITLLLLFPNKLTFLPLASVPDVTFPPSSSRCLTLHLLPSLLPLQTSLSPPPLLPPSSPPPLLFSPSLA